MKSQDIFNRLWNGHINLNPSTKHVYDLLVDEGEVVENDHIAFRTFNDLRINIGALSQVFIKAGFRRKEILHNYWSNPV